MWFILALTAVIGWGVEDVFLKAGTNENDQYSQFRIAVNSGLCFTVLSWMTASYSESGHSVWQILLDNPWFLVIPALYAICTLLGDVGFRYLHAGIMAPLKNAGGAFSTAMFLGWYAYIGQIDAVWEHITYLDIAGTILIVAGVVLLGYVEQKLSQGGINATNKLGLLAFIFPLIYCFMDTLDTVVCGIMLDDNSAFDIGAIDYFRLYATCFGVSALGSWLYIWWKTGERYNPFVRTSRYFFTSGIVESVCTLVYTVAMELEPMYAAVVVAPYCLFTEITAYFYLKERFTKRQYLCFAAIIIGIIMMGFSETMR